MSGSDSERIRKWFCENRHRLTQKGVWFQGEEPGTMPASAFAESRLRVLLVRLSSYATVASGITTSFLYQLASSVEGCFVDMAFMPPPADEKLMRQGDIPLITGTTSKRPAKDFDVIAFSNSVLQELINLPAMLAHSDIALSFHRRRLAGDPLIILGGSNSCTHSALHGIGNAAGEDEGLVDGVLMGDGEQVLPLTLQVIRDNLQSGSDAVLKKMAETVPGLYLPQNYEQRFDSQGQLSVVVAQNQTCMPVKANKTSCMPDSPTFCEGPLLYNDSMSSHVLLTAGCPSFCSFCKESWEQKPYRETSLEKAFAAAMKLKAGLGLSEIALMTFNANTYSDIFFLVDRLKVVFARVAIKSQRFDAVVHSPQLLDMQFDAGKRTYTCAMEGVSERMRTLLQKNLSERMILQGISSLIARDMRQMKVFIIITGYENADDFAEFRAFLDKIKQAGSGKKSSPRMVFSFAVLFRAPHTPMQFAPVRKSANTLRKLSDTYVEAVREAGYEARVSAGPEDALVSELIAYADRRLTSILVKASVEKGFRYHGEIERSLLDFFEQSMKQQGLQSLSRQVIAAETTLPWDDVDTGVSKEFLFKVWDSLEKQQQIAACIAPPWGSGECQGCRACASPEEIARVNRLGPDPAQAFARSRPSRNSIVKVIFRIPEKWAFCERDFIKAALARRLMLDNADLVEPFVRVVSLQPEFFSYGLALAELEFTVVPKPVSLNHDNPEDISIMKLLSSQTVAKNAPFPVVLQAHCRRSPEMVAREIDNILVKQKLKNLKQRHNGWLNWQINAGQAKKAGIEKASLNENEGILRLTLIRWPELHLLNSMLSGSAPEIISLG